MANVRDYLKEKEKRQKSINKIDYRKKSRSHKLTIFYRGALFVLLTIAVIVFFIIQWRNKIFTDSVITSSAPVTIVQGATVKNLGGNVLLYSKDGASCIDARGNAVWNHAYEMQTPLISVCNQMAAIGDYNGRTIYVMERDGEKGTINTNLPIRNFCVAGSGVVAAILDDADVTRIYVYDGNTNTEEPLIYGKATMDRSGYPVSISLSPNGRLMMISYLYADSGSMKSSVAFYNFGEVGQNETDNFVGGYDYMDTIVPYVQFMNNESSFAVSDDRIVFFSGAEKPTNIATNFLEEEVQSVHYNENYVGLVFHNQSGESAYYLDVYNASGDKVHSLFFDIEYADIFFNKDQIIIYNDSECQICNIKGADKFAGSFEKNISLLIPTSSVYRYIAVTTDSVDTIELK